MPTPKKKDQWPLGEGSFDSFFQFVQAWLEMDWGKKKRRGKKVTFERETQIRKSPSSLSRHPFIHLSIGQAIVEEGAGGREIQFNILVATWGRVPYRISSELSCHGGPCDVTQALRERRKERKKKRKKSVWIRWTKRAQEQGFFQGSLQYIAWRFLNWHFLDVLPEK